MINKIASYENLLLAFTKAYRASKNKTEKAYYFVNQEKILFNIRREILSGNYSPKPYRQFFVYEPKRRLISAPDFRDRIVHHALVNIISPIFENIMYPSSYACRKNKGTHRAINLAQEYLKVNKYVLKGDISQYFPSIDHQILFQQLRLLINDAKTLKLIKKIISSYHSEKGQGKGLPIGNLTSQLFANIYLTGFDWYVIKLLKNYFYIRYLDDWLIFTKSKDEIWKIKRCIDQYLTENLKLSWQGKKCIVSPTSIGIPFLGFYLKPYKRRLRRTNLIQAIKNFRLLRRQVKAKVITRDFFQQSWSSWLGHAEHVKSLSLVRSVENLI